MPKKKGKKGKKGKKEKKAVIPQYTTPAMIEDRTKMLCPRLGDVYTKTANIENIFQDCTEKLIQKVAKKKLTDLSLRSLKLGALPDMSLIIPEIQSLTDINISKNQLFNVNALFDTLAQLQNLKNINLSDNFLNGPLPASAAMLGEGLESLNMHGNEILSLGEGIVGQWKNIRTLIMSDNNLTSVPEEAKNWTKIEKLNLKNNQIVEIADELIAAWPMMKRMYLGGNLLKNIGDGIGDMSGLVELDISSNQLEAVPESMALCYELECLHLGNNKLLEFPASMFSNLRKLRELQLYKNKITVVPPEVGNLRSIQRLSLASNQIKGLPEEIGSCTTLKELYLSNNAKFSYFPPSSSHLRNLQELKLYKCPALKQVPTTLYEMESLKELDLRAVKKNVCKITPECMDAFKSRKVMVRGGVVKKIKADLKPPPGMGGQHSNEGGEEAHAA